MDLLETRRLLTFGNGVANSITGGGFESIDRVLPLADGGRLVDGVFRDTTFGSGFGQAVSDGDTDAFVARLSPSGSVVWLKTFGNDRGETRIRKDRADFAAKPARAAEPFIFGVSAMTRSSGEYVTSLAEGPDGSVYVGGVFDGEVDFDSGPADKTLRGNGFSDGFILKISARKGIVLEAWQIGGAFYDTITDLEVDAKDNLYVAGSFERRTDFILGKQVGLFDPIGRGDGFVAKYNAARNLDWMVPIGGDAVGRTEIEAVNGIAVDSVGNVAVGGTFSRTVDFAPGPGKLLIKSDEGTDAYTMLLGPRGKLVWANAQSSDDFEGIRDVAFGPAGSVYSVGYFQVSLDVDPTAGEQIFFEASRKSGRDGDRTDLFLNRFNANGSLRWARQLAGGGYETVASLSSDSGGNVTLIGSFEGSLDIDPSPGTRVLTSPPSDANDPNVKDRDNAYSAFAVQYSPNGVVGLSAQIDGDFEQDVFAVGGAIAANGGPLLVGRFRGVVKFAGSTLIDARQAGNIVGQEDGWILELTSAFGLVTE